MKSNLCFFCAVPVGVNFLMMSNPNITWAKVDDNHAVVFDKAQYWHKIEDDEICEVIIWNA